MTRVTVHEWDMLEVLKGWPKDAVDAVVCDPPYGLSFMGVGWDHEVPGPAYWRRAWHRLKPGGHLVAFSSARTYHRLACAIEDAGFELRDQLMWLYGSGMPKGLNLAKAMDKTAHSAELWDAIRAHLKHWVEARGMTRRDLNIAVGSSRTGGGMAGHWVGDNTQPEIPSKEQWAKLRDLLQWPPGDLDAAYDAVKDGAARPMLGTKLMPPGMCWNSSVYGGDSALVEKPVTGNATPEAVAWDGWNTALKPSHEPIVLARKPMSEPTLAANVRRWGVGAINARACSVPAPGDGPGRWPTNVLMDAAAAAALDAQTGVLKSGKMRAGTQRRASRGDGGYGGNRPDEATARDTLGDAGGASRFFVRANYAAEDLRFLYHSKASTADRDGSRHPTVKPVAVMRWLIRLVTPPGGVLIDPFAGSGTTGEAARQEGRDIDLVEKDPAHAEFLRQRFPEPAKESA